MKKSMLQGCKKVTIAIYSPGGCKISQISFFAARGRECEIVAFFERMDGDYLGALCNLLGIYPFWIRKNAARRVARFYLAVRKLYGRNKLARAFIGRAPEFLNLKYYRLDNERGMGAFHAPSPEAAYMIYKSFHPRDIYVYDYIATPRALHDGELRCTFKRDPHGIGYMRVMPPNAGYNLTITRNI